MTVAACAVDHWGFDSAIDEASSDVATHRRQMTAISSMADARDELARHRSEMTSDLQHIRGHLSSIDWHCDRYAIDQVWSKLYEIEDRVDAYSTDSDHMTDMGSLRATCDAYARDMTNLLEVLRHRMDSSWCW
jgi:hypothetical protein